MLSLQEGPLDIDRGSLYQSAMSVYNIIGFNWNMRDVLWNQKTLNPLDYEK